MSTVRSLAGAAILLAFAMPLGAQPVSVMSDLAVAESAPSGARWARAVAIDFEALRAASAAGSPIQLEAGEMRVVAEATRRELRPGEGLTWFGATTDGGRVTLTVEGGRLMGRIVTPGALVVIEPLGESHVAYAPGPYPEGPDDAVRPPDDGSSAIGGTEVLFPDEMHLLIAYTPAVAAALGASLPVFLRASEDVVNDVLQNSLVPFHARVVHTHQLTYVESGNMSTDLSRIRSTSDGHMDEVHALRDAYSADLVALIVQTASANCGVAYLMDPIRPEFESSGFSATLRSCALGNLTFPHELGHNLGLRHDRFVDPSNTPFTFSHGYVNDDSLGPGQAGLRTTLSYNDQCTSQGGTCTRVPFYSGPTLTFGGQILGDSLLAHNARAATISLPTIAGFRAAALLATDNGNTAGGAFFRRPDCPDPTNLSLCVVGDSVRYEVRTVQSASEGLHHVRAVAGHDAVLLLYQGALDPSDPTRGLVAYAEPDTSAPAIRRLIVSAAFDAAQPYLVVVAGRAMTDAGPYDLEAYGPPDGGIVVQAGDGPQAADGYTLTAPYPNPFRSTTTVTFSVERAQRVRVEAFDVLGRRIAVLLDQHLAAGVPVRVALDGAGLSAGTYGVMITGSDFTTTVPVTRMP
jgi:hypothetical protein